MYRFNFFFSEMSDFIKILHDDASLQTYVTFSIKFRIIWLKNFELSSRKMEEFIEMEDLGYPRLGHREFRSEIVESGTSVQNENNLMENQRSEYNNEEEMTSFEECAVTSAYFLLFFTFFVIWNTILYFVF